jgi:hypothetical protein
MSHPTNTNVLYDEPEQNNEEQPFSHVPPALQVQLAAPTPRPSPHAAAFDFNLLSPPLDSGPVSRQQRIGRGNETIAFGASDSANNLPARPASAPASTVTFAIADRTSLVPPPQRPKTSVGRRDTEPVARGKFVSPGGELLPPPPPLCAYDWLFCPFITTHSVHIAQFVLQHSGGATAGAA